MQSKEADGPERYLDQRLGLGDGRHSRAGETVQSDGR